MFHLRRYLRSAAEDRGRGGCLSELATYWQVAIGGLPEEVFEVAYLDASLGVQHDGIERMSHGTVNRAHVYPRIVMANALQRKAAGIVIAHNHTNQNVEPSEQDKTITRALVLAAELLDIRVDLENELVVSNLARLEIREAIAHYLAKQVSTLTIERRTIEFERVPLKLSNTKPFTWRRNLPPPCRARRTVFNYVATYNDFERDFAKVIDKASDVLRFAALGTTEQGASGSVFRVDYIKPSGAIGFYHPDWVIVQTTAKGEVNWIIETKGRVWEDTPVKDQAMADWCRRVSDSKKKPWRYARVNQLTFDAGAESLAKLLERAEIPKWE